MCVQTVVVFFSFLFDYKWKKNRDECWNEYSNGSEDIGTRNVENNHISTLGNIVFAEHCDMAQLSVGYHQHISLFKSSPTSIIGREALIAKICIFNWPIRRTIQLPSTFILINQHQSATCDSLSCRLHARAMGKKEAENQCQNPRTTVMLLVRLIYLHLLDAGYQLLAVSVIPMSTWQMRMRRMNINGNSLSHKTCNLCANTHNHVNSYRCLPSSNSIRRNHISAPLFLVCHCVVPVIIIWPNIIVVRCSPRSRQRQRTATTKTTTPTTKYECNLA